MSVKVRDGREKGHKANIVWLELLQIKKKRDTCFDSNGSINNACAVITSVEINPNTPRNFGGFYLTFFLEISFQAGDEEPPHDLTPSCSKIQATLI